MILTTVKTYALQALFVGLVVMLGTQTWRLHNAQLASAEAKVALSEYKATTATALAAGHETAREIESSLNEVVVETKKELTNEINRATAERNALLKRVRFAEANAAAERALSKTSPASCNGTGLKRPAGTEFLATIGEEDVEEAYRGDVLRAHLASCYRQYNKARDALSK